MHYPATVGNQAWFRGGRRVRSRWGGAGVAAGLWLLSQLSGCSSSEKNGTSCASLCGDMCKALAACDVEVASDCAGRCATGVAAANCADSRPPDQLTCGELKAAYACADYCATLCTRAPSCGSFDAQLCAQGCTTQSPSICNAASVAARTCDQLKPELRLYEDSARAEQGGSHISHGDFGGTNPYGLCADADDCELPLGCTLITNTCSACAADADCKRAFGPYICSAEKACTKVACASDEDCPGRICDAQRHVCAECREDAHCPGFYKRCNPKTATCGQCRTDADCGDTVPRCDVSTYQCGQCLTNADCANQQFLPRCDLETKFCQTCQVDADCAGRDHLLCGDSQCVDCLVDADCKDPSYPVCDSVLGTCHR